MGQWSTPFLEGSDRGLTATERRRSSPVASRAWADAAEVDGLESDLGGGSAGQESEFGSGGIAQPGIGDDGIPVETAGAPAFPGILGETVRGDVGAEAGVPVEVGIHDETVGVTGPVAAEEGSLVVDDDVAGEAEGAMGFVAGAHDLMTLVEGEQVVPDDVVAAVMLVESGVGAADGDIVFEQDAGAAFIGVEAPTAVTVTLDVLEEIVMDVGAGLGAEGVDAAHVAEAALSDVLDPVVGDLIGAACGVAIAPVPSDRDAGVVEVGDVVVEDAIGGAVEDEDADRRCEDPTQMQEGIVGEEMGMVGVGGGGLAVAGFTDADATGAELGELAMIDGPGLATAAEFESVSAGIAQVTGFHAAIDCVPGLDGARDDHGGLGRDQTIGRHGMVGVGEVEVSENQFPDGA